MTENYIGPLKKRDGDFGQVAADEEARTRRLEIEEDTDVLDVPEAVKPFIHLPTLRGDAYGGDGTPWYTTRDLAGQVVGEGFRPVKYY